MTIEPTQAPDTDTAALWKGKFGNDYSKRNQGKVASNTAMFANILRRTTGVTTVLEFGCGTGQNLWAIQNLIWPVGCYGVEINEDAAKTAANNSNAMILTGDYLHQDLPDSWPWRFDLTMTKGVLIHTPPPDLPAAYRRLLEHSRQYILIAEYYNPTPVEIDYRGVSGALWKRDFFREIQRQSEQEYNQPIKLLDYGFVYRGDHNHPQDDITWFLMEKMEVVS